jgi:hypothetical protein
MATESQTAPQAPPGSWHDNVSVAVPAGAHRS